MSKTILLTGCSRGIGYRAAKRLAAEGNTVFASMRDVEGRNKDACQDLEAWASRRQLDLQVIEMDVTDNDSVVKAVSAIEAGYEIDVLVNNAGIMPVGVTEAFSEDQVKACMDVNLYGVMRTTRAVLPYMRERRSGRLIHLSSTAGRLAIPFFGVYCASKWAMEAFCETLHYEIASFGIQSVIIEPSGHATDLVKTSPRPADMARQSSYGGLQQGGARMLAMFEAMFAEGEDITNADTVAAQIASLSMTNADLPLRVCVGGDMGVAAINEQTAPVQAALIESLKPVYGGA
jgi:NAD(P)-dependent dehydrogenase (short-subunit alcohol dehydrogenase family)